MKNPDRNGIAAAILLWQYHVPPAARKQSAPNFVEAAEWWADHKADLRRRAKQLPQ